MISGFVSEKVRLVSRNFPRRYFCHLESASACNPRFEESKGRRSSFSVLVEALLSYLRREKVKISLLAAENRGWIFKLRALHRLIVDPMVSRRGWPTSRYRPSVYAENFERYSITYPPDGGHTLILYEPGPTRMLIRSLRHSRESVSQPVDCRYAYDPYSYFRLPRYKHPVRFPRS